MAVRLVYLSDDDIKVLNFAMDKCPEKYSVCSKIRAKLLRSQNRITTSSAKGKGLQLQRQVAEDIAGVIGCSFGSEDDAEVFSRLSSQNGTDVGLRGNAKKLFPFDVEAKAVKSFNFRSSMDQAVANSTDENRFPLVVHRPYMDRIYAIFRWDDFLKLFTKYIFRGEKVS